MERRAHGEERHRGEPVGNGIHEERNPRLHPVEHAPEGRTGQAHRRPPRLLRARSCSQLATGNDGTECSRVGRAEEGRARALDKGDEDDHPHRWPTEHHRAGEGRDGCGPDAVGGDHDQPAVPAVGRQPGGQCEQSGRREPGERHQAGFLSRVCEGQDEERVGDRRGRRAR